jgi:YesN/AraC family two-component response regulator
MNEQFLKNAAIVLANNYQFSAAQVVTNPLVLSRMLLWCKAGKGDVSINKKKYSMSTGDYLVLPWKHSITYRADEKEPFLVAGIHIIPDHARNRKIEYQVAHIADHPLANASWRRDSVISGLTETVQGSLSQHPGLGHLGEFVVDLYRNYKLEEWQARDLAKILMTEIVRACQSTGTVGVAVPITLRQMMQYVENNPDKPLSLADLVQFAGISSATIGRMFKQHTGLTPVHWIIKTKMDAAQKLLASSRQNVGEVGAWVGIDDPYYFSKLFKKTCGLTPLEYRRRYSLF